MLADLQRFAVAHRPCAESTTSAEAPAETGYAVWLWPSPADRMVHPPRLCPAQVWIDISMT